MQKANEVAYILIMGTKSIITYKCIIYNANIIKYIYSYKINIIKTCTAITYIFKNPQWYYGIFSKHPLKTRTGDAKECILKQSLKDLIQTKFTPMV